VYYNATEYGYDCPGYGSDTTSMVNKGLITIFGCIGALELCWCEADWLIGILDAQEEILVEPFNLVPLHFRSNSQPSLIKTNRDQSETRNSNPINRSWLNSGRERPTKIVFGVLLLVDRVAVAGFALVPYASKDSNSGPYNQSLGGLGTTSKSVYYNATEYGLIGILDAQEEILVELWKRAAHKDSLWGLVAC
jgi:hypothetical protein